MTSFSFNKTQKTFFIIPGLRQKISDKQFLWLTNFLRKNGFKVLMVPVKWAYRLTPDYISDFEKYYNKQKSRINYVLGFSYGAVIALLTANKLKPEKIYLCSLSPDFKEDLPNMKAGIRKLIGNKRIMDIRKRSAIEIAQRLKIPSVIFYGEVEGKKYPFLKRRCLETHKLAKNSRLVVVKNTPHRINYPEYVKSIKQEIQNLLKP